MHQKQTQAAWKHWLIFDPPRLTKQLPIKGLQIKSKEKTNAQKEVCVFV
jgi:hypothetical protein